MINITEKKEETKKLYISDEELAVDEIYSKVQGYLTAHVYYFNESKDLRHSDEQRAFAYMNYSACRANVRQVIEFSGLTDDEKFIMLAYYLDDKYNNYKTCAQRTGYSEKEVARLHARAFVKVAKELQRTGKLEN